MAFPTGWQRRCSLTINHTKVPGDLSDFIVMLFRNGSTANLPSEPLTSGGSFPAKSAGEDIRFSSDAAGTNELAFEITTWTQDASVANQRAQIFVKVPSVSSSVDTVIYMWYSNSGASAYAVTDTYGRNAVWSNCKSAAHFGETTPVDSTGSNTWSYDGGSARSSTGTTVTGVGRSRFHNNDPGSRTYCTFPAAWSPAPASYAMALSLRKAGNNWGSGGNINIVVSNASGIIASPRDTNGIACGSATQAKVASASNTIANSTWYRIVFDFDSSRNVRVYVNGSLVAGPTVDTAPSTSWSSLQFGHNDLSFSVNMNFDDVMLHKSNLSTSWVTADYNSFHDGANFATVGTPETPSSTPVFDNYYRQRRIA